ncbi:hypothetical protein Bca52824_046071 [Brassica carinata]|uniref:Uncharacterized protein n=1 Tax=Brassica carinata TaxID=52824 RepID=A0A8X7RET6_BRACI|nr:hypothetical protein Bca52824_046071 [Brassica carinata]
MTFTFSRIFVLCSCFKTVGRPQPSSISRIPCSSSSWCHTTIDSGPSRSHFASVIFVVSQLFFSLRCDLSFSLLRPPTGTKA